MFIKLINLLGLSAILLITISCDQVENDGNPIPPSTKNEEEVTKAADIEEVKADIEDEVNLDSYNPFEFTKRESKEYKVSIDSWETLLGYLEESREEREIIEGMQISILSIKRYKGYDDRNYVVQCESKTSKIAIVVDIDNENIYMLEEGRVEVVGDKDVCGLSEEIREIVVKEIDEVVALPELLSIVPKSRTILKKGKQKEGNFSARFIVDQYMDGGERTKIKIKLGRSALGDIYSSEQETFNLSGDKVIEKVEIEELDDLEESLLNKIDLTSAGGYNEYSLKVAEAI